ncbi:acyl-CoA dehydrogenase family protein [Amycolatopsis sp. NPDC004747]
MAAATDRPGATGFPSPPEPGLTPAEVVARAEAIAPSLVALQQETEQRTAYGPDVHEAFRKAGFYRILVPRRYGGYEFGVETFLRVVSALARGCPSTGWMYCFGASHAVTLATLFGEQAQEELFEDGDFICPTTIVPNGTAEQRPDGSWTVSGTWGYCSGAPYASAFIGHTVVPQPDGPPKSLLFAAPRSVWKQVDDWGGQLGLRGSGSHSITIHEARIPAHYAMETHLSSYDVSGGTPGFELHGNPEFRGAPLSFGFLEGAALAVGMAQGALDAYEDLMRTRTSFLPPIVPRFENRDYQAWYGEAAGLVATAEAATRDAARQWHEAAAAGPGEFTTEKDLKITAICRQAVQLAWRAVERHLFPTAGSSSARAGERMERVWRDLSMLQSHSGYGIFLTTAANRGLARVRFDGLTPFEEL